MNVKTGIDGVVGFDYDVISDNRGNIVEVYRKTDFPFPYEFSCWPQQMTHTRSNPGVLRGLHGQGWNRVIYPVNGKILQVFVDLREKSSTFGKVVTEVIEDSNRKAFFVPAYVANGYAILGDNPVDYLYIIDGYYDGKDTINIAYNDPDLKINWQIKNPIISKKDKNNSTMRELFPKEYR